MYLRRWLPSVATVPVLIVILFSASIFVPLSQSWAQTDDSNSNETVPEWWYNYREAGRDSSKFTAVARSDDEAEATRKAKNELRIWLDRHARHVFNWYITEYERDVAPTTKKSTEEALVDFTENFVERSKRSKGEQIQRDDGKLVVFALVEVDGKDLPTEIAKLLMQKLSDGRTEDDLRRARAVVEKAKTEFDLIRRDIASVPDPEPQVPDPEPQVPDPEPQALDPEPQAPDPEPQAPDPEPQVPVSRWETRTILKVGMSLSSVSPSASENQVARTSGFEIGLNKIVSSTPIRIDSDFKYVEYGWDESSAPDSGGDSKTQNRLRYLVVGPAAHFDLTRIRGNAVSALLGVDASILIDATSSTTASGQSADPVSSLSQYKYLNIGLRAGLRVNVHERILLEASGHFGISDVFETPSSTLGSSKNRALSLTMGISL